MIRLHHETAQENQCRLVNLKNPHNNAGGGSENIKLGVLKVCLTIHTPSGVCYMLQIKLVSIYVKRSVQFVLK